MVQTTADDERAVQLAREAVELVDAGHKEVGWPMIISFAPTCTLSVADLFFFSTRRPHLGTSAKRYLSLQKTRR